MRLNYQKWKPEEVEYLSNNWQKPNKELGKHLNRTASSISRKRGSLKLPNCTSRIPHLLNHGDRFGKLTVVKYTETKANGRYYLCQCDCGSTNTVNTGSLRSGNTQSCGCLQPKSTRGNPGDYTLNCIESQYKWAAKDRGYSWNLTREEFRRLVVQDCHYCGAKPIPKNTYYDKSGRRKTRGDNCRTSDFWANKNWISVTGIDRRNNNEGYFLENCISCCTSCNEMKLDHSIEYFINHIIKIFNHQKDISEKT